MKNHDIDEDDFVPFNDVSVRTDQGKVEKFHHNSHSYVLVFKLDLVHDKCIVTAHNQAENQKRQKHSNNGSLKLCQREFFVIVLIDSSLIGVYGVEIDDSSGKEGEGVPIIQVTEKSNDT